VKPGQTALNVIPVLANSSASARVRPMRPWLRRAIGGDIGVADKTRSRRDVDQPRARASRFQVGENRARDEIGAGQIDSDRARPRPGSVLSNGALGASPALLTRMVTGPSALRALSSPAETAASEVTSNESTITAEPSGMKRAMSSSGALRRPARLTRAPARARASGRRHADAASRACHQRMMAVEKFVCHVAAACAAAARAS